MLVHIAPASNLAALQEAHHGPLAEKLLLPPATIDATVLTALFKFIARTAGRDSAIQLVIAVNLVAAPPQLETIDATALAALLKSTTIAATVVLALP